MTATKVWEYRPTPDRYASHMGSVQRLTNGNTLINWAIKSLPKATEVTPDGNVVYEMNFSNPSESYRSFRYEWTGVANVPYLIAETHTDKVTLIFNKFGDPDVSEFIIYGGQSPDPSIAIARSPDNWIYLTNLENNKKYYFRVTALNNDGEESSFSNQVDVLVKYAEPGENLILNSDFTYDLRYWLLFLYNGAVAKDTLQDGTYRIMIDSVGSNARDIQLKQKGLDLVQGRRYVFEFDAFADEIRTIDVKLEMSFAPFIDYTKIGSILLTPEQKRFSFEFVMQNPSDYQAHLVFYCGNSTADIYLDNISLKEVIPSRIIKDEEVLPQEYALLGNFPNPFNNTTMIRYIIAKISLVKIRIYNILGQQVEELISLVHDPGRYSIKFDASKLSSGIYYLSMEAVPVKGGISYHKARKIMLLR
jgi:hypothetical protein